MIREEAIKYAAEIKAFQEGKTIQSRVRGVGAWREDPEPEFDGEREYRVKPEPREWWVNIYGAPLRDQLHQSKEEADRAADNKERVACVRAIEVLE